MSTGDGEIVWHSGPDYSGEVRNDPRGFREPFRPNHSWRKPRPKRAPADVEVSKANPEAWQAALRLADGDPSRLTVHSDGSVTVNNQPQRRRMADDA